MSSTEGYQLGEELEHLICEGRVKELCLFTLEKILEETQESPVLAGGLSRRIQAHGWPGRRTCNKNAQCWLRVSELMLRITRGLAWVSQRGRAVSIPLGFQDPAGQIPEQPDLSLQVTLLWASLLPSVRYPYYTWQQKRVRRILAEIFRLRSNTTWRENIQLINEKPCLKTRWTWF